MLVQKILPNFFWLLVYVRILTPVSIYLRTQFETVLTGLPVGRTGRPWKIWPTRETLESER